MYRESASKKTYHYFYKIVNLINSHYYYGIHSTDNLNDGYMGSGKRLHRAYKKYGIENFEKTILKYFQSRKEASEYEKKFITEDMVRADECYNIIYGGDNAELVGNLFAINKETNEYVFLTKEEFHKNRYKYFMHGEGMVVCYLRSDTEKKTISIPIKEFRENREKYSTFSDGRVIVKDEDGNCISISKDDERYLSGEMKALWYGKKHKQETKERISKANSSGNHKGVLNSHYGKCWIVKGDEEKCVRKEELEKYMSEGWVKGRNYKSSNGVNAAFIPINEIVELHNNGMKVKNIAKHFGITTSSIEKVIKKSGLSFKDKHVRDKGRRLENAKTRFEPSDYYKEKGYDRGYWQHKGTCVCLMNSNDERKHMSINKYIYTSYHKIDLKENERIVKINKNLDATPDNLKLIKKIVYL